MSETSSRPRRDTARSIPIPRASTTALDRFAEEAREAFIRMARREIRRRGIDEVGLTAEGAVHRAYVVLCRRIREGKIPHSLTREELGRVFHPLLLHTLEDDRRRHQARKRGRSRLVYLSALEETGFDPIDPKADRPDLRLSGEERAERLLELLDRVDRSLRAIAVMKAHGRANPEIASELKKPVSFIKRQLDRIRTILGPHKDERG